ncbi:MAG TPA: excinuclease ABC subunit C [Firmicutes bacterium]|nr:excinuclease ABC subunit C [Bacillota bacterium]
MMPMFKEELSLVPHLPGSYQMYDKTDTVIYVGKAKDLKNRLTSYFTGRVTGKTAKLVSEIAYFKYIVTSTENEAFILELNLIKKYDPKYNILLRDDKSYPYIEYIRKPYPRLKIVRYLSIKKAKDRRLFGPYPNQGAARRIVNLLNRLYPLKKCEGNPKEVCLYYHIGECLGYCTKRVDEEKLQEMEQEIISFLRGNDTLIKDKIMEKIQFHSEHMNYEVALELKRELDYMSLVLANQKVELTDLVDRDIVNYYIENGYISINIFFIRHGKLLGTKNEIFPIMEDHIDEIEYFIGLYYAKNEVPNEIIINEELDREALEEVIGTKVLYAERGNKKKLLDLASTNAKISLENKFESIKKDETRTTLANEELKNLLGLDRLYRIDIFDNSNLFGEYSVSGMVVFKDGRPSKNDYRKFKISLEKNDDYNTMKEVLYRRYYRMLMEKSECPDLILLDGGENQINAAKEVMEMLNLNIKLAGLKKNDKHQTNDLVDENLNLIPIDRTSNLFHFLTRMQDEVHRFTITYHRTIRSKGSIQSILDNIEGLGEKRRKALIKKFGSMKAIKTASIEELSSVIPTPIAKNLRAYLDSMNEANTEK